jgi:hypothetical protein
VAPERHCASATEAGIGATAPESLICQKSTLPVRFGTARGENSMPNEYDLAFSG